MVGVVLINIGLFVLRTLVELGLTGLQVTDESIISTCVFVIRILGLLLIYTFYVRMYEKRKPSEIALTKTTFKQISFGALVGFLCISSIVGINWLFGWISVDHITESPEIIKGIYHTVFFVLLQDFVFFLILFRVAEKYLGTYLTILATGLVFGFKHLLFPNYTVISGIFIFIDVTFIFSALYLKSRSLWEIFGFHLVYNLIQNNIFGNPTNEGLPSIIQIHIG
jgi:membrane protease YdiL (CAAX protease family)